MRKRILASLLTLVMILSLAPMTALAVEPCTETEGCTLGAGHDGECVIAPDEPRTPEDGDENDYYGTNDVTDPAGPTAQEQLAALVAALPDPADIDPTDEVQVEAVYYQIAEIYAFAEENGLGSSEDGLNDAALDAAVNAVIAAAWPAEAQVATTASGTDGGIDWSFANGILTISAASSPENGYDSGKMQDYTNQSSTTVETTTDWYSFKDSITEVKIEEGVTYLGDYAFSYLTNVTKANIPASITDLGDHLFRGDTALTTVEWAGEFTAPSITDTDSNHITYTGTYVPTSMFDGCTSLGSGVELSTWLPSSFTGVGCAAFRGTAFSVDFDQWSSLTYIGTYGFAGMPNLTSVTVKNTYTFGLR